MPLPVVLLVLMLVPTAQAQGPRLYAAVLESRGYVVGSQNAPSGLHRFEQDTLWSHLGWRNVRAFGLAADPADGQTLYLAAGNGLLRSTDSGGSWRVTTDWQVTEVLDVTVSAAAPEHLYVATAYGVWHSPDRGDTWAEAGGSMEPTFTQAIASDRQRRAHLIAGSEGGLFRSTDGGGRWSRVGPSGVAVRDVEQSAASPSLWLAGTEDRGVLLSDDGGETWRFAGAPLRDATVYAVALHPTDAGRMAAAGYGTGVFLSTDGGATWVQRGRDLADVHALAFDPDGRRLWAGTMGAGVYVSDDQGEHWTYAGLNGATVYDLVFTAHE